MSKIAARLVSCTVAVSYLRICFRSYGHWLETSKSANRNLVPSPNTKNHLLSLSELLTSKPKISTFGTFAEKHFLATFHICLLINVQDYSTTSFLYCSSFISPYVSLEESHWKIHFEIF